MHRLNTYRFIKPRSIFIDGIHRDKQDLGVYSQMEYILIYKTYESIDR